MLTEENWFKVGLANNHKKEYSALLTEINDIFPNSLLYAGFSRNGEICLASEEFL